MITLISRTPAHDAVGWPTSSPITWVFEASGGVTFDLGSVDIFSTAFGGFVVEDGVPIAGWTYTAVLSAGDTILTITLIPDAGWGLGLIGFFVDEELDFLLILSVEDPVDDFYRDDALLSFTTGEVEPEPGLEPLTPVPEHCDVGKSRLISQFHGREFIGKVICIWGDRIRLLDLQAGYVRRYRGINEGFGIALDKVGFEVEYTRNGLGDEDYRRRLRGVILARASHGRPDEVIGVMLVLLDGAVTPTHEQHYPAAVVMEAFGIPNADGRDYAEITRRAVGAGIAFQLLHSMAGVTLFGWDEDEASGFFAESDDDVSAGTGIWAEAS